MSEEKIKVGIILCGNIGCSPLLAMIIDERADRGDLDAVVATSGAKLGETECLETTKKILAEKPKLILWSSPNAALPGPTKARDLIKESGIPAIIISDAPSKKAKDEIIARGNMGFMVVQADSMIGARREFLDPTEMVLFNADLIKVLALTGVFNLIVKTVEDAITALKKNEAPPLPQLVVTKDVAIPAANYLNPYARAKATAAHEMAESVAKLNTEGCFKLSHREEYMPVIAAAHEIMRAAALLADEAREIEKGTGQVFRAPHYKDGKILKKTGFVDKPE
ncbi:MAG: F420-dependent methylenetetrahydromethanopterin dehydrogenase [Candidatus Lokiarchaeota archaeon]|nr:F420-dependent methylenetetrahydromethanopterin dehydrogenase [Candidatus Lokiarchaeota archaeon]